MSSQPGSSNTGSKKRTQSQLNKKERKQVIARLRSVSGALLLDQVVKQVPQELHMQHYPERAEITCLSSRFV